MPGLVNGEKRLKEPEYTVGSSKLECLMYVDVYFELHPNNFIFAC